MKNSTYLHNESNSMTLQMRFYAVVIDFLTECAISLPSSALYNYYHSLFYLSLLSFFILSITIITFSFQASKMKEFNQPKSLSFFILSFFIEL